MIKLACPKCPASYDVPDQMLGKRVVCKNCKTRFIVGGIPAPAANRGTNGAPLPSTLAPVYGQTTQDYQQPEPQSRFGLFMVLGAAALLFGFCCIATSGGFVGMWYFANNKSKTAGKTEDRTYGGILITSTRVTAVAVKIHVDSAGQFDYDEVLFKKSVDTNLATPLDAAGLFAKDKLEDTKRNVEKFHADLKKKYSLSDDQICIVGGSGVLGDEKRPENQPAIDTNKQTLQEWTQEALSCPIQFVDTSREQETNFRVLVNKKHKEETVLIHLGGSSSRATFMRASDVPLTITGIGLKKFQKTVQDTVKNTKEDHAKAAERLKVEHVQKPWQQEIKERNELKVLKRVYLIGGIPWVVATHTNPEERTQVRTKLTMKGLNAFAADVRKTKGLPPLVWPTKKLDDDLYKLLKVDQKEIEKKFGTYETLAAGTELLLGMAAEFDFANREVYFSNYGDFAELLGVIWDKFEKSTKTLPMD
jgi:hypothetical protein